VEIDSVSLEAWNALLPRFADATIYQTWDYGAVRWGEKNIRHVVVKQGETAVAMCQVAVKRVPLVPVGVAFVSWGPLWRLNGRGRETGCFRAIIGALKAEFANRQGLALRIDPCDIAANSADVLDMLQAEGFYRTPRHAYTTIIMDLSHDIDAIRRETDQKWRNQLNKAEKNGLTVEERADAGAFNVFLELSAQMIDRKKFVPGVDYQEFKRVFERLAPELNMKVLVCKKDDAPVATAIYTKIGERAIYILGATGNAGLTLNGSNLTHWEIIKRLKAAGCTCYDLGGVNPIKNPGVFRFKQGLSGKNGVSASHIGEHEYCSNPIMHFVLNALETVRGSLKKRG
jgi:lipid II:glycine glycyltransferase (peptidoglycan interpeptide bridge formation enzyme)